MRLRRPFRWPWTRKNNARMSRRTGRSRRRPRAGTPSNSPRWPESFLAHIFGAIAGIAVRCVFYPRPRHPSELLKMNGFQIVPGSL